MFSLANQFLLSQKYIRGTESMRIPFLSLRSVFFSGKPSPAIAVETDGAASLPRTPPGPLLWTQPLRINWNKPFFGVFHKCFIATMYYKWFLGEKTD